MLMFHTTTYDGTREQQYETVIRQLEALIEDEPNLIANLSNASALLGQFLTDINWVGFYITEGDGLVLGPFQGLPACVRIPIGRGVCGTSAQTKETVLSLTYMSSRAISLATRRRALRSSCRC